jgi:hypothetical protein
MTETPLLVELLPATGKTILAWTKATFSHDGIDGLSLLA